MPPHPLPRRQFLRGTALTLAATAFPTLLPVSVLGRGGLRSPNDRIQMGFIGLGGQGTGHLLGGAWTYVPGGYVARNDVQVLAVCDVRQERRDHALQRCRQLYAQKYNQTTFDGVLAYRDFREVLGRPDIDAVLLALPYHWAAPMATLALRAGKDVYCEKPIAITVREGLTLVETARRHGRIYQAGTQQRSEYAGKFRLACDLVRNGRLGQLKEVYAYRQPGAFFPTPWTTDASQPVPAGFDWDLWLGPLPWRPFHGEAGHALTGCFVGDVNWSPHHYDFICWAIDADPNAPVEIRYDAPAGRPDAAVIHYHFSNGVVLHSSSYPNEPIGDQGGACFVGTEGRLAVDRAYLVTYPSRILHEPPRPQDRRVERCDSHSGNFLECVRSRRPTICHPETAVASMNTILSGGIALALQRSLRWHPAQAQFINDDQANRLLSYTPRPPWLT